MATNPVLGEGPIAKMQVVHEDPIRYSLPMGGTSVALNALLGGVLTLEYLGSIECVHCGRETKKSFNQGYCYPCCRSLAQCDLCVVRPELCHYAQGTCREPAWGEEHCFQPHSVYLANSSGLKVGITRGTDPITRWIDQGATQGLVIRTVQDRLEAGRVEVAIKQLADDRTDWRKMLRGDPQPLDLAAERDRLLQELTEDPPSAQILGGPPLHEYATQLRYPVRRYPLKLISHNLDKNPLLSGRLDGIKGQYLILDGAVINIRKYAGYRVRLSWKDDDETRV